MKVTNAEIYRTKEPLTKLMNSEKFHVKVCMKIVKLAHMLEGQIKQIDEVKNKLIKDYGCPMKDYPSRFTVEATLQVLDKDGNPVLGKDGKQLYEPNPKYPEFAEAMDAMFDEEIDLEFEPVKLPLMVASTCPECHHNTEKELQLEPAMLMSLEKFITF